MQHRLHDITPSSEHADGQNKINAVVDTHAVLLVLLQQSRVRTAPVPQNFALSRSRAGHDFTTEESLRTSDKSQGILKGGSWDGRTAQDLSTPSHGEADNSAFGKRSEARL